MNQSKNQLTEKISGIYNIMEKNEKTDSDNNTEIIDIEELKFGKESKRKKTK